MIAVIDYGMGNLRSVQKALEAIGADAKITSEPSGLAGCDKIVFPGVGSFGDAMKELERSGMAGAIKDAIAAGKPFLGLCLGMQLLFERSEESSGVKGLCILKGEVKRFRFAKKALKIPHMGWNTIVKRPCMRDAKLLRRVPDGSYMYFVHSYYVIPKDRKTVFTKTGYGIDFVSGICKDNIFGFQFHPEKSQSSGLIVLKNFVRS